MDRLDAMRALLAVVRSGGFAPAARELGISTSAMSRHIQSIENWLGVQLLRRTTRNVSLTSDGESVLAGLQRIVDDVDAFEDAARGIAVHPRGEVRVTAPTFFGQRFLGTTLMAFQDAHPEVKLRLHLIDRVVNLVEEGFDLALRIGHLEDSALMARRIGVTRTVLTAVPGYLEARGCPKSIDDLEDHNCLVDLTPRHGNRWQFVTAGGRKTVEVSGRFVVNDGEMVRQWTLEGRGISMLPDFFLTDDISAGRLVPLLKDHQDDEAGIYLVYVKERHRSAAVQALIDWLAGSFMDRR